MIYQLYKNLLKMYGKQNWWPVSGKFKSDFDEVAIGAVLTQNTNWNNVEKALKNLIDTGKTSLEDILQSSDEELYKIIKPAGFYRQKTKTLKNLAAFIEKESVENLNRDKLLSVKGIGEETADTIALYGLNQLEFVVDKYTKRLLFRLGLLKSENEKYFNVKQLMEKNLPPDIEVYKEFHALIVEHGKRYCRKNPLCDDCPLKDKCYNS